MRWISFTNAFGRQTIKTTEQFGKERKKGENPEYNRVQINVWADPIKRYSWITMMRISCVDFRETDEHLH